MKKLVLFLVLSIPLFLLGCAEEEEKPTCSVTADDFTYERLGFYKYQLKLKDPNKEVKGEYFWEYNVGEVLDEHSQGLEAIIDYSKLYHKTTSATLYLRDTRYGDTKCGTVSLPIFTNPICKELEKLLKDMGYRGKTEHYNHSPESYQGYLTIEFNGLANPENISDNAKMTLEFKNGEKVIDTPFTTPNKQLLTSFIIDDTKKLEDAVLEDSPNIYYLQAELHTTFKDNTKCVNDVFFSLPWYKP